MRPVGHKVLLVFLVGIFFPLLKAERNPPAQQQPASSAESASALAAKPSDVASPDAILAATYDVISGPAGRKRDWARFRSLFAPGARLIPIVPSTKGGFRALTMTPDEYATRGALYFEKNSFYEREIARKTERWGRMVQAFSTYESRHARSDAAPFERGINSFQLFFDSNRWWIVTIMWQSETPLNRLTPEFLPPSN
jgi:hypothetical protein